VWKSLFLLINPGIPGERISEYRMQESIVEVRGNFLILVFVGIWHTEAQRHGLVADSAASSKKRDSNRASVPLCAKYSIHTAL
jgi:hypothetical protein